MPDAWAQWSACANIPGAERDNASQCEAHTFQSLSLTEGENPLTWKTTKKCMNPIDDQIDH